MYKRRYVVCQECNLYRVTHKKPLNEICYCGNIMETITDIKKVPAALLPIDREKNQFAPVYNYWRGNKWVGKIEKYRQSSGSATTWKITGRSGIIGEKDTLKGAEQVLFASA